MRTRRIKKVRITAEFLTALFTNGHHDGFDVTNGFPDDAKIIGANYDAIENVWEFGVSSSEYDPVPINERVPEVETHLTISRSWPVIWPPLSERVPL